MGRALWIVGTLGLLGMYTNMSRPILERKIAPIEIPAPAKPQELKQQPEKAYEPNVFIFEGRKYVMIENKFYEFRADNRYKVKGVPTYYANNSQVVNKPGRVTADMTQNSVVQEVNKLLQMNPAQMYTREGVEQLLRSLEASRKSLAERDKALEGITN